MAKGDVICSIKPSDTSRSTDVTVTNDPHLGVRLQPNEIYSITVCLIVEGGGGGFRFDTLTSSGGTWSMWDTAGEDGATNGTTFELDGFTSIAAGGDGALLFMRGEYDTSGSVIDFRLAWGQDVSHANDSTIMTGSWIKAQQIDETI